MCGLVGVFNQKRLAADYLYVLLAMLQHRGKQSAGAVISEKQLFRSISGLGEVLQVFSSARLSGLGGKIGIGHVRYGTSGAYDASNIQPLSGSFKGHDFFLAHNGNLVNTRELKRQLGREISDAESDTRVIAALLSSSRAADFESALLATAEKLRGAFNLVLLFDNKIYALRDPFGFHPLQLGRSDDGWVVASENCAFNHLGVKLVRDIAPGELLVIDQSGPSRIDRLPPRELKFDIFEFIYFSRPDSTVQRAHVGSARKLMGRKLALEHEVEADIIVPVPDSGNNAALGFYRLMVDSGVRVDYEPEAIFRPRLVGRTFIEPIKDRKEKYLLKFNPQRVLLRGRRVVLVDDSIVRGNSMKTIIAMVRRAGARKVSVVSASPKYRYPDFYGIDTHRDRGELIARRLNGDVEVIRKELGADYLGYLSLEATIQAILEAAPDSGLTKDSFYTGPFTGEYPAGVGDFAAALE